MLNIMIIVLGSFVIGKGIIVMIKDIKNFKDNRKLEKELKKEFKNKTGIYSYLK